MIIAGVGDYRSSYFINMANNTSTKGPSLLKNRAYFACHNMHVNGEDYIIVVGGEGATTSTEYLSKTDYGSGWKKSKNRTVVLWHDMRLMFSF